MSYLEELPRELLSIIFVNVLVLEYPSLNNDFIRLEEYFNDDFSNLEEIRAEISYIWDILYELNNKINKEDFSNGLDNKKIIFLENKVNLSSVDLFKLRSNIFQGNYNVISFDRLMSKKHKYTITIVQNKFYNLGFIFEESEEIILIGLLLEQIFNILVKTRSSNYTYGKWYDKWYYNSF